MPSIPRDTPRFRGICPIAFDIGHTTPRPNTRLYLRVIRLLRLIADPIRMEITTRVLVLRRRCGLTAESTRRITAGDQCYRRIYRLIPLTRIRGIHMRCMLA